jgi:hypothetical protein
MFQIVRTELNGNGRVVGRQPLQPPYDRWEDAMAQRHLLGLALGCSLATCPRLMVPARRAMIALFVGDVLEYGTESWMRWPPVMTRRCR